MDATSNMAVNTWVHDGDKWYWVDDSGHMLRGGWHYIGGTWYYLTGSGAAATGWLQDGAPGTTCTPTARWGRHGSTMVPAGTGWTPRAGALDAGGLA